MQEQISDFLGPIATTLSRIISLSVNRRVEQSGSSSGS